MGRPGRGNLPEEKLHAVKSHNISPIIAGRFKTALLSLTFCLLITYVGIRAEIFRAVALKNRLLNKMSVSSVRHFIRSISLPLPARGCK
jgi:hypothetical protein